LPIEINLSYVSKDYRKDSKSGFQTKKVVKTDHEGRGITKITGRKIAPLFLSLTFSRACGTMVPVHGAVDKG